MEYKKALITGATSGIGNALLPILLHEKISCMATGRDLASLREVEEFYQIPTILCDLTKDREPVLSYIRKEAPDLVINCAGSGYYGAAVDCPKEKSLELLRLNAEAVLDITIEAAAALKKEAKRGVIMNISSVAGDFVFPGFAVYASSKSFVTSFSLALDLELKSKGIRVLVACPGRFESNFSARSGGTKDLYKGTMSTQFAAEEVFWQIMKKKPCRYFNWPYRIAHFLSKIVPGRIAGRLLFFVIKNRFQRRN